jgi:hypothetical protein
MQHISEDDLERYHLGRVVDQAELDAIETHLIDCEACARNAEQAAVFVDAMRAAIVECDLDLDL